MKKVLFLILVLMFFVSGCGTANNHEQNNVQVQNNHIRRLTDQDIVKLRKKVEQGGRPHDYFMLGMGYFEGKFLPLDHVQAVEWLRKAAERGYVDAQLMLGICFLRGWGVDSDAEKGFKWILQAQANGLTTVQIIETKADMPIQYLPGLYYFINKDFENGNELNKKAIIEQNSVAIQCLLYFYSGVRYEIGIDGKKDINEAIKWYTKSAEEADVVNQETGINVGDIIRRRIEKLQGDE